MINNTKKIIYLLNTIKSSVSDYTEEMNKLYSEVIIKNRDVASLCENINHKYNFYHGYGENLANDAKSLLSDLEKKPEAALQTIGKIKSHNNLIMNHAEHCEKLLRSAMPIREPITVIKKENVDAYKMALERIAAACVYLIVLYNGASGIKNTNLSWSDGDGIQERIRNINTNFLPALENVTVSDCSWIIKRKRVSNQFLLCDTVFCLEHVSHNKITELCSTLESEPIGAHAFLNVKAFNDAAINETYCWGTGNILSVSPKDALKLLNSGFYETARSPVEKEYCYKMPKPLELLKMLYDGKEFCASADELASAMNQWESGYYIQKRMDENKCLFCGRALHSDRLICKNHIVSEL
ncbi:MAG: hypothetical protein ACI4DY_00440 [Monoglobaceae bacterium]